MSDHHRTTVWPALQAHDPDLVIRTLVALGFEETAAHRDEAGFLYIDGRLVDMIKVGSFRVSPLEVEEALATLPGIAEMAVASMADELLGQRLGVAAHEAAIGVGGDLETHAHDGRPVTPPRQSTRSTDSSRSVTCDGSAQARDAFAQVRQPARRSARAW